CRITAIGLPAASNPFVQSPALHNGEPAESAVPPRPRQGESRIGPADPRHRAAAPPRERTTVLHPRAGSVLAAAATRGVILMLPFYFSASDKSNAAVPKYVLAGTKVDGLMWLGMILSLVGIAACAYGVFPKLSEVSKGTVSRIRVRALDDAKI